jgi:hypothetical protein
MHRVAPLMVFSPRLIVITSLLTKGRHNSWQVVSVFATHVFFHQRQMSANAIIRNGCHTLNSSVPITLNPRVPRFPTAQA